MKKFFAIAVIAIAFVACNNEGEKTETPDSTAVEVPVVDTTVAPVVVDTTAAPAVDTTTKM